jgi:O-antigen/teichoic acid export membrane protein
VLSTALYAAAIAWAKFLSLLMVPIVTRMLPPGAFGKLDLLSSAAEIGGLLVGAGLVDTLFRFAGADREGRRSAARILALAACIAATSAVAVAVLAPRMAPRMPLPTSPLEIALIGASVAVEGLIGLPLAWLRMEGRVRAYVAATAARATVQSLLVGLLVWRGFGVDGVLAAGAAVAVGTAILASSGMARDVGFGIDPRAWGGFLGYGLPLVGSGFASFALGTADRWLLAPHVAAAQLGVYAVACKFASVATLLTQPIEMWWYPRRFRVLSGAGGHVQGARILDGFAALYVIGGCAAAAAGPTAVRLLVGPAYGEAAEYVPWLCVALLLQQCTGLFSSGAYAGTSGAKPFACNATAAAVALAGYLLLIPRMGVAGAVAATLAGQTAKLLCFHVVSQRELPLPHRLAALAAVAVPSLAGAFLPTLLPGAPGLAGAAALLAAATGIAFASGIFPKPHRRVSPRGLAVDA